MATHVYRWLEKYAQEENKNINVSFSYLDARTFKIVDDKKGVITGDLRNDIKLDIQELINLHGFERKNKPSDERNLFKVAVEKFKELIEKGNLKNYFDNYKRDIFIDDKGDLLRSIEKFEKKVENKGFKAQGAFLEIIKTLPEDYKLFDECGSFKKPKNNNCLEKAIKFLDGGWLELYVYNVLKEKLKDDKITIDVNWVIKKSEWQRPHQNFELDLILIKGYQLIGISCTTSEKRRECKSKGFEIFMRTRQIGGEEARAVLITRLSETQRYELQAELEIDTGGRENILVLGCDDLEEEILVSKIKDYII